MKKIKFAFFAFALFAFTNNSIAQTNNSNNKNMERYNQLDALHDSTKSLSVNFPIFDLRTVTNGISCIGLSIIFNNDIIV